VERQQLEVIKVIHPDVDLRHGDGIDDIDRQDLAFERLTGIFWALAVPTPSRYWAMVLK
jgi:hypothetical protein